MPDIQQAIDLIKQGRKREAQSILETHIRANPHDIKSWFWYVETLDAIDKRIQFLEVCLKQNPGNPQVIQALEMLRDKQSPFESAPVYSSKVEPYTSPNRKFDHKEGYEASIYGDESSTSQSLYDKHGWEGAEHKPEISLPNIDIPENEQVIEYLRGFNPFYEAITPYAYGNVNNDRTHSDFTDAVLATASDLPENCKYVVYGCAALVHPVSGVIFAFAFSMDTRHRMPAKTKDEIDTHFERVFLGGRKRKKVEARDQDAAKNSHPLGRNWSTYGLHFTPSLMRKCYDFYGKRQDDNGVIHLNVEEDLEKIELPTFFDKLIDWVSTLLFILVFSALAFFIFYAIDKFRISDVIDFFRNLR